MTIIEKYRTEFNDLLNSDPNFNYSDDEFYEWLADMGLTGEVTEELKRAFEEELDFSVNLVEQDGVIGAEVEGWTKGGVDMIAWLHPFTAEEFNRYVEDFDTDEQIDLYRQAEDYRNAFTCRQSVEDFDDWKKRLQDSVQELEILGLL
ncbi:hypothetical protein [Alistipes sp.]|uniref:hypothetical protein n=1 Tax=Alistipes sp. TaxID=1872444 RepID=UPI0035280841